MWEDGLTEAQIEKKLGRERVEAFCSGKSISLKKKIEADGNIWETPARCGKTRNLYQKLVTLEIYGRLCFRIFGCDHAGRQAYVYEKRHIANMKIMMKKGGIKDYDTRFKELDSYLPYCPWQAGMKQGKLPKVLTEERKQEILLGHLSDHHLERLDGRNWDVLEHTFDESISELLRVETTVQEQSDFRADLDMLLEERNLTSSRFRNGKRNRSQLSKDGNSRNDRNGGGRGKKGKTRCNNCDKFHLG